jgi:hypothetical protein
MSGSLRDSLVKRPVFVLGPAPIVVHRSTYAGNNRPPLGEVAWRRTFSESFAGKLARTRERLPHVRDLSLRRKCDAEETSR